MVQNVTKKKALVLRILLYQYHIFIQATQCKMHTNSPPPQIVANQTF